MAKINLDRDSERLLRRFEVAAKSYAWIGGSDPEDYKAIRNEYQKAKKTHSQPLGDTGRVSAPLRKGE